jgi:hypothetical protein
MRIRVKKIGVPRLGLVLVLVSRLETVDGLCTSTLACYLLPTSIAPMQIFQPSEVLGCGFFYLLRVGAMRK